MSLSPQLMSSGLTVALLLGGGRAVGAPEAEKPAGSWTILFYGAGDGSAETSLLKDIARMKASFVDGQGVELILLIDRHPKHSDDREALGEDFADTRLYRVTRGKAERLGGGKAFPEITTTSKYEANTGDPVTLRKFIRFGKTHYPAKHYALVVYGHGDGRAMCPDLTDGWDELFPAALSDTLTKDDSVDLMFLDVCSMAGAEVAYQWRPGNGAFEAKVLVACASVGGPPLYDRILPRLRAPGEGKSPADGPKPVDPAMMTPLEFGTLMTEVVEASLSEMVKKKPDWTFEAWGCFDLAHAAAVKRAVDAFAVSLAKDPNGRKALEAVRGSGDKPGAMHYMPRKELPGAWLGVPYFDLYDLARRARESDALGEAARREAGRAMAAVRKMTARSFGQQLYEGFEPGRNGLFITFPDGGALHEGKPHWSYFRWYSPLDRGAKKKPYGRLAWCRDGATPGNGVVENWFELLDSWYDTTNDEAGGVNGYRW